ncbi:MAG: hypothetical protein AAFV88_02100 [Planctomycetota bacterium]
MSDATPPDEETVKVDDAATGVSDGQPEDEGPGCMPAILAATVLMGIAGFILCGFMAWLIFQKQDVLAKRALRGSFIPAVEQSLLEPEEKTETVRLLNEFADELERGQLEGWQISGVMQRLDRLPVVKWGQMRRVEAFVDANPDDFESEASIQFDRLRSGVANGDVVALDFTHILSPVLAGDETEANPDLMDELPVVAVRDVVERARLVADRADTVSNPKSDTGIDTLVRRQIEAGVKDGGY